MLQAKELLPGPTPTPEGDGAQSSIPSNMSHRIFVPKNHSLTIALIYISFDQDFTGVDSMTDDQPIKPKRKSGFALLSPEKRREMASLGGRSVPAEKRSFAQNPDLAAQAGRKGGKALDASKRPFSTDHSLAISAGAKGGRASHGGRRKRPAGES
jgi:uncharacterized protein